MSRAYLIEFQGGKPANEIEFSNSWGGAARIWCSLYDRYLKDPAKPHDSWASVMLNENDRRLWELVDDPRLSDDLKAVHLFTFDYFLVRAEHFAQMAADLCAFADKFPVPGKVDHLKAWADVFAGSTAEAIGLHATSVTDNLWEPFDSERDEYVPYDLNTGEKHQEVYDWLAEPIRN